MEKYQTLFNVLTRYGLTLTQSEMDEIADAAKPLFGYECSHSLADLLERLRKNQKDFFGAQPGSLARQTALHESKRLEKQLDAFLQKRCENAAKPPDLFSSVI